MRHLSLFVCLDSSGHNHRETFSEKDRPNGEFIYKRNPDGTWVNISKVIFILCLVEYK